MDLSKREAWQQATPPDGRRRIERTFDSAHAVAFEAKADGPNEWKIEFPKDLIEELRLAVADTKFAPESAFVKAADGLATELPPGRIVRLAPLAKAAFFWQKEVPAGNNPEPARDGNLAVGNQAGGMRSLVDWPAIPPEDVLGSPGRRCFLAFDKTTSAVDSPSEAADLSPEIQIYEVTSDWPDGKVTWESQPPVGAEPVARFRFTANAGWKLLDITPLLKVQAESGRKGYGVLMRLAEELPPGPAINPSERRGYTFHGRNNVNGRERERVLTSLSDQKVVVNVSGAPLLVIVDPEPTPAE